MIEDAIFRTILAALALALYLNHLLHRYRFPPSHIASGLVEVGLIAAACLWTLSMLAYVCGFTLGTVAHLLPLWLRWVGVCLMVLCIPLSLWVYRTLGVHFSTKLQLRDNHQIICTGPYRFVRHPMYTTFFLCAVATMLISADLVVMATAVATALMMRLRVPKEEAMLLGHFGEGYREYMQHSGALFPRVCLFAR